MGKRGTFLDWVDTVSTNQEFQGVQRDPLKRPKAPETGLFYA